MFIIKLFIINRGLVSVYCLKIDMREPLKIMLNKIKDEEWGNILVYKMFGPHGFTLHLFQSFNRVQYSLPYRVLRQLLKVPTSYKFVTVLVCISNDTSIATNLAGVYFWRTFFFSYESN